MHACTRLDASQLLSGDRISGSRQGRLQLLQAPVAPLAHPLLEKNLRKKWLGTGGIEPESRVDRPLACGLPVPHPTSS